MISNMFAFAAALLQLMHQPEYLGSYRATAYSGNNGSTYGASGRTLIPGYSVATCDCIPLGSLLYINGIGLVRVDDRMGEGAYVEEHDHCVIDLYLEDYSSACKWGAQWVDIMLIEEGKND